jgi:hypothetical protein
MHRPHDNAKRDPKRERHRLAEARRRARKRKHVKLHLIRAGEIVYEALKARNEDAGMIAEKAERATLNHKKVDADLSQIVLQWARVYLAKRQA